MAKDTEAINLTLLEKLYALYQVAQYRPVAVTGIIGLSFFAAILEGIGISFLIPVVEIAQGNVARGEVSAAGEAFIGVYDFLGIAFSLESVVVGVGVVMTARYLSSFLVTWLQTAIRVDYVRHLQSEGFENALKADVSYYDTHGSEEILNAIVTQTEYAGNSIRSIVTIIQQAAISLMYLGVALVLAPLLTFITVVILGGGVFLLRYAVESGIAIGGDVAEANERVQESVQAGTQGIREVKLFGVAGDLHSKFRKAVDKFAHSEIRLSRNEALLNNFYQLIIALVVFGLIYVALRVVNLPIASLGVFLFAIFRLAPRASTLNTRIYQLEGQLPHLVRTQRFIQTLREARERDAGTASPPTTASRVAFDEVSFSYGNEPVLKDLSFDVHRGEFIAFVGKSGAGKSTIVSLITRFYNPDSGQITANGTSIHEFELDEWRDKVSVVRQDPHIFNDTLRYNITLGNPNATIEEIEEACEIAQVTEFSEGLANGLDTVLGDDGVRLSGGQRQRVAIARALLKPADILILDEATSDLDTTLEQRVHEGIERLSDYVLIVIAHRLSTITDADRIYVMAAGTVTESGTHKELVASDGTYAELFSTQH